MEDDKEDPMSTIVPQGTQEDEIEEYEDHHLSFNALKGGRGVGTIRFIAFIENLPVTVLIDGGSSDNVLQPRVAKFLKLPVEPATQIRVMVGKGNYMYVEGLVKQY